MTLSIKTFGIATLSIRVLSGKAHSLMKLNVTTLSAKKFDQKTLDRGALSLKTLIIMTLNIKVWISPLRTFHRVLLCWMSLFRVSWRHLASISSTCLHMVFLCKRQKSCFFSNEFHHAFSHKILCWLCHSQVALSCAVCAVCHSQVAIRCAQRKASKKLCVKMLMKLTPGWVIKNL